MSAVCGEGLDEECEDGAALEAKCLHDAQESLDEAATAFAGAAE